mmetsp:Transcript_55744/g.124455  ORF Transcript_55744/g.124455 Transcript_55744/m.124455 type:complete len:326 (+) Transcript_55744:458-1435(+)
MSPNEARASLQACATEFMMTPARSPKLLIEVVSWPHSASSGLTSTPSADSAKVTSEIVSGQGSTFSKETCSSGGSSEKPVTVTEAGMFVALLKSPFSAARSVDNPASTSPSTTPVRGQVSVSTVEKIRFPTTGTQHLRLERNSATPDCMFPRNFCTSLRPFRKGLTAFNTVVRVRRKGAKGAKKPRSAPKKAPQAAVIVPIIPGWYRTSTLAATASKTPAASPMQPSTTHCRDKATPSRTIWDTVEKVSTVWRPVWMASSALSTGSIALAMLLNTFRISVTTFTSLAAERSATLRPGIRPTDFSSARYVSCVRSSSRLSSSRSFS